MSTISPNFKILFAKSLRYVYKKPIFLFLFYKKVGMGSMRNQELIPLILSIREGQNKNFEILYELFRNLIVYFGKHLKDDDAIQELTVFLLEIMYTINLDKFVRDESSDLKRYIAVSIRNKYIALSKSKQFINNKNVEFSEELSPYTGSIISYNDYSDNKLLLSDALQRLTNHQRQIILYHYYYGYSVKEIAEHLHVSRQSVNQTLRRGLHTLREYIKNT